MSAHQAQFPIQTVARVLRVTASGYYAWRSRPASARATADADLTHRIRTIHAGSRATYSAPRVHAEFAAEETRMSVLHFIEGFYNPSRRHSALGYLSPIEYERRYGDHTKLTETANRPQKRG